MENKLYTKEEVLRLMDEQKMHCFYEWTKVEEINFTNKVKDAILNAPYPESITKEDPKQKCPNCASTNIYMFDGDSDACKDCKTYFPAIISSVVKK